MASHCGPGRGRCQGHRESRSRHNHTKNKSFYPASNRPILRCFCLARIGGTQVCFCGVNTYFNETSMVFQPFRLPNTEVLP